MLHKDPIVLKGVHSHTHTNNLKQQKNLEEHHLDLQDLSEAPYSYFDFNTHDIQYPK